MILNRSATFLIATALLLLAPSAARGQRSSFLGSLNPLRQNGRGIQFSGVSFNSGYSTEAFPSGTTSFGASYLTGPVIDYGLSTGAGWSRNRPWGGIGVQYSLSYNRIQRLESGSSYGFMQAVSVSVVRNIGTKSTLDMSIGGTDMHLGQSLFRPTAIWSIASVPTNFDDLVSVLIGGASNAMIRTSLIPSLLVDTPMRDLLYGTRMLGARARIGYSYAATTRLAITADGSLDRAMPLADSRDKAGDFTRLLSQTTSVSGSVGISYAISQRTNFGVALSTTRVMSNFQDAFGTSMSFSLNRTLSQRLFVQGSAGTGRFTPLQENFVSLPRALQWTLGGSIGYKTYAHTFVLSGSRTLGDSFGIGGGTSIGVAGAWNWSRPGRSWNVGSSVSQQRVAGSLFANPHSLQANVAFAKGISSHISMSVNYAHLRTDAVVGVLSVSPEAYKRRIHSVRVGLNWTPGTDGLW